LLRLLGLSRRQLQTLEEAKAVAPSVHRGTGKGHAAGWAVMTALGIAYAKAFAAAGCHATWGWSAARWVARQRPEALAAAFAEGRVLLAMAPGGEGRLIEPRLRPGATRERRLEVAQLDLGACCRRVLRRAEELGVPLSAEERALLKT
jgi:hypothetical protein